MKAAVINEHGGPGSIRYEPAFPDPQAAADEVVVRVKAASLNYHDIFTRRGMPGIKVPMPCIMGIDFAGEIAELGAGVTGWAVVDRVLIDPVDRVGGGGLVGEVRPAVLPSSAQCRRIISSGCRPTCPTRRPPACRSPTARRYA